MKSLTGHAKYVRTIQRSNTEVQLTSEAAWALYFSTTESLAPDAAQPQVEIDHEEITQSALSTVRNVEGPVEFEICSSCNGDGHFDESGSPTSDRLARPCLTCSGKGLLPKP